MTVQTYVRAPNESWGTSAAFTACQSAEGRPRVASLRAAAAGRVDFSNLFDRSVYVIISPSLDEPLTYVADEVKRESETRDGKAEDN